MGTPSPMPYTRAMSLPIQLPADLDELDDGLPDPTPEEIAGILEARAAIAQGEGIPLDEVEARTERVLRERARARRAGWCRPGTWVTR